MILFDGGFGTYYEETLPIYLKNMPPEFAVLRDPAGVADIHRQYLESGANAIKTNTFGVNLGLCETKEECSQLIRVGFEIASVEANAYHADVYADIGPITTASEDEKASEYAWIAAKFIECGAENFLFETMSELPALLPAIELIRKKRPNATVIICFAVSRDGYTKTGEYYKPLLEKAQEYADYVGLNCQCGPVHMKELFDRLDCHRLNCVAMPNAGYPALENGRTVFRSDPEYFAQKTALFADIGVKGVGGCCGTTPEHIGALIRLLGKDRVTHVRDTYVFAEKSKNESSPFTSRFGKPIAVEIPAPVDTDCGFMLKAARLLRDAGTDYITVPDSPLGNAKADSIMMAAKIRREIGIPVIPHMTCRDKNQLAVKGQLLAASMENLHDILVITGDPVQPSLRQNVKQVFGFTSFSLISYFSSLNEEVFSEHPFHICAALNTSAGNFEAECARAQKKIANGAQCLFTQPVYSKEGVERIRYAKEKLSVPIFAGIMPVAGYRNALFLNNEVSGIDIPQKLLEDLKDTLPEEAKKISIAYAAELIDSLYETADGFYIMTPLKKVDFSLELVKHIREKYQQFDLSLGR